MAGRTYLAWDDQGRKWLADLEDVDVVSSPPTANQALKWDGDFWKPGSCMGDLADDKSPQLGADLDSNGYDIDMANDDKITFRQSDVFIHSDAADDLLLSAAGDVKIQDHWTIDASGRVDYSGASGSESAYAINLSYDGGELYAMRAACFTGSSATQNTAIWMRKSRGSASSPSAVANGDRLGTLRWSAYCTSAWNDNVAIIRGWTNGIVSGNNVEGMLTLHTQASGGSLYKAMELDKLQNVDIPNGSLDVDGDLIIGGDADIDGDVDCGNFSCDKAAASNFICNGNNGVTTTFTNADRDTVTVTGGIITDIS